MTHLKSLKKAKFGLLGPLGIKFNFNFFLWKSYSLAHLICNKIEENLGWSKKEKKGIYSNQFLKYCSEKGVDVFKSSEMSH